MRGRKTPRHATLPVFVPHVGCRRRCSFCDQSAISGAARMPSPEEVETLCREGLDGLSPRYPKLEVAFFGGSFTAIPREKMLALLKAVQPFRGHPAFGGIRVSTRPDAIDRKTLDILWENGVRAIELGAQSLVDQVLEANGRGHTAEQVRQAAMLVRQAGFELGLQMMTGLYQSSPERDWETGLGIAALAPDTVRVYPTVVLPGTGLARLLEQGGYAPPGLPETVELCARLLELFEGKGIRVIRLGLHAEDGLAEKALAGCFHPALGELCRGFLLRQRIRERLAEGPPDPAPVVLVPPRLLSQALGQRRQGLLDLRQDRPGLVIRPAPEMEEDILILYQSKKTEEVF